MGILMITTTLISHLVPRRLSEASGGGCREPDGACDWQLMVPAMMESNYSVPVPWAADDKASMFPAFIYTRYNN